MNSRRTVLEVLRQTKLLYPRGNSSVNQVLERNCSTYCLEPNSKTTSVALMNDLTYQHI